MTAILRRKFAWGLLLASAVLAIWLVPLPMPTPQERHITIDATQFQFSPYRLEVNYGDHIVLTLTASDVVHGFYLDGYGLEQRITPDVSQQIEFIANQTGKFRYRCAVSCGPLHPFMIGELVVDPNLPFWRSVGLLFVALLGISLYLLQSKGNAHVEVPKFV